MTRCRQPKLKGEAAKVARSLGRRGSPPSADVIAMVNRQGGDFIDLVLNSVSGEDLARRGLIRTSAGKLAIMGETDPERASKSEAAVLEVVQAAKIINKGWPPAAPEVVDTAYFVIGYGKPVVAEDALGLWRTRTTSQQKVDAVRRTLAIREAEVGRVAHSGDFGKGLQNIDAGAEKLMSGLAAPAPRSSRISWRREDARDKVDYSLINYASGDEHAGQTPLLVAARNFGTAIESNALLGHVDDWDARCPAPDRFFTLRSETVFAASPELAGLLSEDLMPAAGGFTPLDYDQSQAAADYINEADTSLIAPALTKFIVTQRPSSGGLSRA